MRGDTLVTISWGEGVERERGKEGRRGGGGRGEGGRQIVMREGRRGG